jgi:hypothetical protein
MNELTLNIYNLVTEKIPESIDWTTTILTIIGILMAYYALLYNRARIEIIPNFESYDFKTQINNIKLCFHNVGSSTAFNVKLEHTLKKDDLFHYPEIELQQLYNDIKKIIKNMDAIGNKALLRKTDINNNIIYNDEELEEIRKLNKKIKDLCPNAINIQPLSGESKGIGNNKGIFYEIRKNDKLIKNIDKKYSLVKSCLDIKLNTLIAGEKKINYLTDYSYFDTYIGEFKIEDFTVKATYNEIKKMDIISIFLLSIFGLIIGMSKFSISILTLLVTKIIRYIVKFEKFTINYILKNKSSEKYINKLITHIKKIKNKLIENKIINYGRNIENSIIIKKILKTKYRTPVEMFFYNLKMFLLIEFNLEKMEIIINRKEIKTIKFNERVKSDDLKLQRQLNNEKYMEFKYKEFEAFVSSFIFQNWLDTLNQVEKQKIKEILLDTSKGVSQLIEGYEYYKNKIYSKKSLINKNENFLNKYVKLIHIINNLPERSPLINEELKEKMENIIFHDEWQKKIKNLSMK